MYFWIVLWRGSTAAAGFIGASFDLMSAGERREVSRVALILERIYRSDERKLGLWV